MTDASKKVKLESVKKEIRALLISSQGGIPLFNFLNDYYEVVGLPLDFTELGFYDLENFLQAIPDVCGVVRDSSGQKILRHVTVGSTKHIEKMVARQKPISCKKNRNKARGGSGGPFTSSGASNNYNGYQSSFFKSLGQTRSSNNSGFLHSPTSSSNNHNHRQQQQPSPGFKGRPGHSSGSVVSPSSSKCLSGSSPSSRLRPQSHSGDITTTTFRRPPLPNFIRVQIQQTLTHFHEPVTQSVFENAFRENFGAYLNFEKCGFGSMDELLRSIADSVIRTKSQKTGEPLYKLVSNNVADHRGRTSPFSPKTHFSSSPLHNSSPSPSSYLQTHSPKHTAFKPPTPNSVLQTSPLHSKSCAPMGGGYAISPGYPNLTNTSSKDNSKCIDPRRSPTALVSPNNFSNEEFNDADDIHDLWYDDFEMSVNPDVTQKIEQVLGKHPKGLYASMLCAEYQKMYRHDLDYRVMGYLSVIELISKLKSVRIVRPTVSGDWLLFDAQKPLAEVEKLVERIRDVEINKSSLVKEREKEVRHNISKMLETIPEGVNLDQFLESYKEITGDEFQPIDVGFKSLESYILSLASNIVEISYTGNACLTIKSIKTARQDKPAVSLNEQHESPKSKNGIYNSSAELPEDAVGPGVSYRLLDISIQGECVEVFVSNVVSPGEFWIQLRGKQHSIALEKLMDDLEALYCSSESNAYQVPDDFIRVGIVAATVYPEDQNWHRILITSVPNLSYVEVYFVDYGNTCIVARRSLRLLRRDFLNLPMQAIQGRLANVKPIGDKWTVNARNRMLKLTSAIPLMALVVKIKDRVLSLCLIDTNQAKVDLHINDVLINEEYAFFSPDNKNLSKSPVSSASVDSSYYSSCDNVSAPAVKLRFPTPRGQQSQPGTQNQEGTQEEKKVPGRSSASRPTSIHRESPSASPRHSPAVSPTFGAVSNSKQTPKVNNLALSSSNSFQNIPRPTSISTSCANQAKMTTTTGKSTTADNNSFMLHCTGVSNHVPKVAYPISKGNDLKPFVKKLQLTEDYAVHIFYFNGTACISSGDLSSFLWKIDIVRTMLRTVNLGISKVIICEEDYLELFLELKRINFSGLWDGEERKDWVTLFRLEDVPVVLETFNHPSAELKMAVQIAIRSFDSNDDFWKGKGEDMSIGNSALSSLPICKHSSPKPIPRSVTRQQSPTVYSEQTGLGLSSSASPPLYLCGKGSPSQRTELKPSSSAESSPRSRRPSTVTLEDIKTINANLTRLHKLRQCIIHRMEKGQSPIENYATTLESVESKLQKLNALLIQASPTVESKDPPGQGRLLSPYQNSSNSRLTPSPAGSYSNSRLTPSPAGSLGFSPRDTRSIFQSPSPSPTQFDSWGERKSMWPQLRPFLPPHNQRLYSPPSFPLKVPESTPLTPQILSQMLDSQSAALFAASGMFGSPSDPLVAVNNCSYSSGVSSCTSSNLNTPASPFSPSRNSPPSRNAMTGGASVSSSSARLLPGLYPLLHPQSTLTCLGRGSPISNLSISPPIWPTNASPSRSPGFLGQHHSPSRNLLFSPSPSSPHSLPSTKGHN